jgi:hypothetical protein
LFVRDRGTSIGVGFGDRSSNAFISRRSTIAFFPRQPIGVRLAQIPEKSAHIIQALIRYAVE